MTDRNKFEAMLEALINEDHEAAKDIFHNIVVGKSREIYEKLLAEEFDDEEEGDDEFGADDEEEGDDEFGADDDEFGADDEGDDEFGDDDDSGLEDRVMDLEDALDELKSEFEQLLAGEEDEPEHDDMFGGDDDMMGGDDDMMGGDDDMMGGEEENEFQSMFEYVNKVALPKHGDNGVNTRSSVAGKTNMGGVALKFGGTAKGEGTQGGLLNPKTQDLTAGLGKVQNRSDSNAGKTGFKKQEPGHGAEKKGNRESAPNTKSLIPGRK